ncbi:hypothetical protein DFP78_101503 [Photobacterium lutimaris]|nr:hypothetical protein DFP78_101503 [Photobacterium lutimaris]
MYLVDYQYIIYQYKQLEMSENMILHLETQG